MSDKTYTELEVRNLMEAMYRMGVVRGGSDTDLSEDELAKFIGDLVDKLLNLQKGA